MKIAKSIVAAFGLFVLNTPGFGQTSNEVVITGVRFAYPLVEKWIGDYKAVNPQANIRIETRTITDPQKYDLLIEAYEQDKESKEKREYVSVGRYALLPVANAKSAFAKEYGEKGLTEKTYKQLFFHDIYAEKDKTLPENYTVYTRLQKAGAPVTFAKYFGYQQQNIKGKSIAGADEHLIKALLKDETGVTYTTIGLAYDPASGKPAEGLTIIPVDLDGNGKVSKEEKALDSRDALIASLETQKVKNVPIEYIHFSIDKQNTNAEAKKFLLWVAENAEKDLHAFGYLKGETGRLVGDKEKLESVLRK
ncbi:substrate-binding domain-containing protein [Dyadobacter sp. CY343]|uniref:substrate-binding domain-containing protein n=1 Tax=Dyadobacter sp. CY343 TaxID=2907299 RepID=UPI001F2415BC|nr:substrate-binding domain-containing protein [Dyadobacter sp. CY343]MCE7062036.1 substrate-binding domain-containing protein [Dyadobacter sp. CY343]